MTRVATEDGLQFSYDASGYKHVFLLKAEAVWKHRVLEEELAKPEYTRLAKELSTWRL